MIVSTWRYRSFILRNAMADLRHRYAGTGMGVSWNIIHPLAVIVIYSIVFSRIMPLHLAGHPGKLAYTIYLCSGFFPWLAFSDCVGRGCNSFIANADYLKRLPIPEQVFVAQNAASSTLGLAISFALLVVVAAALNFHPTWRWLLLPIPLAMFQAVAFGVGLLLGTLNVFFRDIGEWTNIGLQMVMWTVPIVYMADILPAWAVWALRWHPLMPALVAIRALFFYGNMPNAATWIGMFMWPAAIAVVAGVVLHKLRPEIRDVI